MLQYFYGLKKTSQHDFMAFVVMISSALRAAVYEFFFVVISFGSTLLAKLALTLNHCLVAFPEQLVRNHRHKAKKNSLRPNICRTKCFSCSCLMLQQPCKGGFTWPLPHEEIMTSTLIRVSLWFFLPSFLPLSG